MSNGEKKRRVLFDKLSSHLSMLLSDGKLDGIILEYDKTYICPICLDQFSESDLNDASQNMLTFEDAPPDSLGGNKIALTCKSCNSKCGHNIDFHLLERMTELDSRKFLPNSSQKGKTSIDGVTVNSEVRVNDKSIEVVFTDKNNNPQSTKEYLNKIIPDETVNVERKKSRVDGDKLQMALLKTAYILTFSKFGYNFILDSCFDIVREQLKNTDKLIYPEGFWTYKPFEKAHEGIYFILEKGYEAVLTIFPLKTKSSVRRFGVVLPLPNIPIIDVTKKLKKQDNSFALPLDPMGGTEIDYLFDKDAIDKMNKWIEKLSPSNQAADPSSST